MILPSIKRRSRTVLTSVQWLIMERRTLESVSTKFVCMIMSLNRNVQGNWSLYHMLCWSYALEIWNWRACVLITADIGAFDSIAKPEDGASMVFWHLLIYASSHWVRGRNGTARCIMRQLDCDLIVLPGINDERLKVKQIEEYLHIYLPFRIFQHKSSCCSFSATKPTVREDWSSIN